MTNNKKDLEKKDVPYREPITKDIVYDLSRLKKMMGDDKKGLDRMILLFIELTPNAIQLIKKSYLDHRIDEVYRIAHSLKPSIDLIGIHEMKTDIRKIEELAKKGEETDTLAHIIDKVELNCMQVIEVLKKEID
jgi:HPt (histidine-containing phosphotransfer) domain-containing protein